MALLWAGCWAETARAQDIIAPIELPVTDGTDLRFVRLSSGDESLPAGVTCIVQDDQGFIWFGTENGLRRYDGYRFREFRNDPNNPDSLSGSQVYSLFSCTFRDFLHSDAHGDPIAAAVLRCGARVRR
jgi:ligand-binding sensor domain-containing protein